MKRLRILFCLGIMLFLSTAVLAGGPKFINFQGSLSDNTGHPITNPSLAIVFSIYNVPTGGTALWTETQNVDVKKGNYNVLLGNQTAFPVDLFTNENLYLGIKVGTDPEMTPRNQIGATPSALHALKADSAGHSQKADSSGHAQKADHATKADTAGHSQKADHANKADTAGHADRAKRADTADVAYSVVPESVNTVSIKDGSILLIDLGQNGALIGQIIKWNGTAWVVANDSMGSGTFLPLAGGTMTGAITNTGNPAITMGKGNFGTGNVNPGIEAFVAGNNNKALGDYSVVSGGGGQTAIESNEANGDYSTVGGGTRNKATQTYSTVGGGWNNFANNPGATVAGGDANIASGVGATVGGGNSNTASGNAATVGGGDGNIASGTYSSTIAGGVNNTVSKDRATVGGGDGNIADGIAATVSGGENNTTGPGPAGHATIGGGLQNMASGDYSAVGGGVSNTASGSWATVSGGDNNTAIGAHATVGGGKQNTAGGLGNTTVGGGVMNTASGPQATVSGGDNNTASGSFATVPGGTANNASGDYSFAVGRNANAVHPGAFVWADQGSPGPGTSFLSTAPNQFNVRAVGGTRIYSNIGLTAGVTLASGASAWAAVSDSTLKRNIRVVDGKEILNKVLQLPIKRWSYKAQDPSIEHIGPMAQDFYPLFRVGDDEMTISTIDPSGIALAAIQELYKTTQEQNQKISELERLVQSLLAELKKNSDGNMVKVTTAVAPSDAAKTDGQGAIK